VATQQNSSLYYARWNGGEVDIIYLSSSTQNAEWAVEVKWTDKPYYQPEKLDNCIEFIDKNPSVAQPLLITSRTIEAENFVYQGVRFHFRPASLYAYVLGANILQNIS
jgi:hypothetical protein